MSLFEDLSQDDLLDIADLSSVKKYNKHQIIYRADEPADEVFVLSVGTIKIISKSGDGREVIKTIIHPNSLFGTEYISSSGTRNNSAKAIDKDVVCLAINSHDFKAYLKANWTLTDKFIKVLGTKLMYLEGRFESLVIKDCLLYTSPSPRDATLSRMPSSA